MSTSFETSGTLHEIFDEQQVTDKFRKREFVLLIEDGAYPQHIKFQLNQDRCNLISSFDKGDMVKVSFNLSGRPYTNKEGNTMYFSNLVAWRLERVQQESVPPPPDPYEAPAASSGDSGDFDDLPF